MKEEFEEIFHDEESNELVSRYEEMLKSNRKYFFDVFEFESIIDYYIDTNKANNALSVVKFAAQQHPNSLNLQLKEAQVLIDKGLAAQALKVITQVEIIESTNSDVFLIKGSALNVLGKYSDAEKAFDQAIEYTYEDQVDVIHTIAQSFDQIGRYKTALKYLLEAYKLDDTNIMILYDIGYCYEKLGQINRSIEFYNQYLDREPFSENAWYNLGIIYNKNEMYDKAVEAYEFALAINPDFSVAYFNLANSLSNKEEYHKAIINYKEYLKFDDSSVEVITFIGDCYENLGEYDLALKYYDEAIAKDQYYSDSLYGKANVMVNLDKPENALKYVEDAIVIDEINPDYYYLLGNILTQLDRETEALVAYKKAYGLDPDELDYILSLTESYVNQSRVNDAIELLTDALKDLSDNAILYYQLSACYFLVGETKKALKTFESGLKINPRKYMEIVLFYPNALENKAINKLLDEYYFNK
jgi:tetratricopeptide (TPR) repeat protein